ncbi:phage terminase large subunit [Priestia aryabhattai]|uniref:phage terminase large subunit n=1 Tax=Priestia aryabhattai TaxID=412384 RepID=UPI0009BEC016
MSTTSYNKSKQTVNLESFLKNFTDDVWNKTVNSLARTDYGFYVQHVHRGVYVPARHTDLICKKLEAVERGECTRLILCLPPRHSKSMTVSETFPSWFIGKNPHRRVIQVSYGDSLAQRFGRENKKKINEYGKEIFDIGIDRMNASNTNFGIEGYRGGMISAGVQSSVTGEGADLLVVDDPIKNRTEALSPAYKNRLWNEWQNTLLTRLHPGGAVIIILTRWSEDDLVGRLLEEEGEKWDVISLPAEAEDDDDLLGRKIGEPLWPERGYDEQWLTEKKKEVGSQTWASLYQQRPSPESGNIINRSWWKYYKAPPAQFEEIIQSWDCSFKDMSTSDYVVGTVWGRVGANRYLLDMVRDKMGIVATMQAIRNMTAKYPDAQTKLVEDKANGTAVIEMLKNEIAGIVPYSPKESKVARLQAVSPQMEAGNIWIPDPSIAPWVHDYVEEITAFPNGKHDDICDSTSMALLRFMQAQPLFIGRA